MPIMHRALLAVRGQSGDWPVCLILNAFILRRGNHPCARIVQCFLGWQRGESLACKVCCDGGLLTGRGLVCVKRAPALPPSTLGCAR
jgi:hypothetical protein